MYPIFYPKRDGRAPGPEAARPDDVCDVKEGFYKNDHYERRTNDDEG